MGRYGMVVVLSLLLAFLGWLDRNFIGTKIFRGVQFSAVCEIQSADGRTDILPDGTNDYYDYRYGT